MTWPLVLAESVVAFERIDGHILERRASLERWIMPHALDYGQAIIDNHGLPSDAAATAIRRRLYVGLAQTLLFGYNEAKEEILALRRSRPERPMLASEVPTHPYDAARYLGQLVARALGRFHDRMQIHWQRDGEAWNAREVILDRARREAHNMVLELVGEVLNAGRTLAALGQSRPETLLGMQAALYAMRTERLDTATCGPCRSLHGRIVAAFSLEYFDLMPPSECLGGGRCRGFYVYGDSLADFEELPGQTELEVA